MLHSLKAWEQNERWVRPVLCIVAFELAFAFLVGRYYGYIAWPEYEGYWNLALRVWPVAALLFLLWHILRLKLAERPTKALAAKMIRNRDLLAAIAVGTALVFAQKMALSWAKPALGKTGFWADPLLAETERRMFGADVWQYTHWLFGPNNELIDRIYFLWFPAIITVFFFVLASRHELKSRVIVAYFLAVAIGVVVQFALPSGGPIFYSRLGFGDQFGALLPDIPGRSRTISDYLIWYHLGFSGGTGIGISAWPSIHITAASWVVIAVWALKRPLLPLAVAWWAAILLGSVYLGWHYLLDGIAGAGIALGAWAILGVSYSVPSMRVRMAQ